MVLSVLIVAILVLFISLAFCFAGYRFFRLLLALWDFLLTTQALAASVGSHILVSTAGVIIAVIVGLIVAALAYWLYVAAVVILSISVGFWIGNGLLIAIGYGSHSIPALLIGIACCRDPGTADPGLEPGQMAHYTQYRPGWSEYHHRGSLAPVANDPPDNLSLGLVGAIIRGSPLWGMVWLVLTGDGLLVQVRSTQRYAQDYAHAQF
jgi:hypothetical protein